MKIHIAIFYDFTSKMSFCKKIFKIKKVFKLYSSKKLMKIFSFVTKLLCDKIQIFNVIFWMIRQKISMT